MLHRKFSAASDSNKVLYVFPNDGAWFSKPGFSFYYRSGKLPIMEEKIGFSGVEIRKINQKGDRVFCSLRTTREWFSNHSIELTFNLKTGDYSKE